MAFKAYTDINWSSVRNTLENYAAIQAMQQLCLIHGDDTEELKQGCLQKLRDLITA